MTNPRSSFDAHTTLFGTAKSSSRSSLRQAKSWSDAASASSRRSAPAAPPPPRTERFADFFNTLMLCTCSGATTAQVDDTAVTAVLQDKVTLVSTEDMNVKSSSATNNSSLRYHKSHPERRDESVGVDSSDKSGNGNYSNVGESRFPKRTRNPFRKQPGIFKDGMVDLTELTRMTHLTANLGAVKSASGACDVSCSGETNETRITEISDEDDINSVEWETSTLFLKANSRYRVLEETHSIFCHENSVADSENSYVVSTLSSPFKHDAAARTLLQH